MAYYDDFVSRNTAVGLTPTEYFNNYQKEVLNQKFDDSPFYRKLNVNGIQTDVRVVQESEYNKRTLLFKPDKIIDIGSYVDIDSDKWITVDFFRNELTPKATIQLCNSTLKWLDEDGLLKQYPCVFESPSQAQLGIKPDTFMNLETGKRRIFVKKDSDTTRIKQDRRFIVDSKAYRVTDADPTSHIGLILMTLEENQISPSDNLDLGIADSVGKVAQYSVSISNGHSLTIRSNRTLQLSAVVKNSGLVVDKPVVWSVSNPSIASINSTGLLTTISNGAVTVTVKLAIDLSVLDNTTVTIQPVASNVYTMLINSSSSAPDEIKNNQIKTYQPIVYFDGTVVNESVSWAIFSDDRSSSTTLASISSQSGTSCTLKNNNVSSGFIQLRATLNIDNTVILWKRIQMKPLV